MTSLAYVFWHQPRQRVDSDAYERSLGRLLDVLSAEGPEGFRAAFTFRHLSLPWAAADAAVYEDWYIVDGFATLGAINSAAVSGPRKAPHDAVARNSEWGAGGIYGLVDGAPSRNVRFTYWISKPPGWTYERFFDVIQAVRFEAVWQRQMVLGPAPEFCIHSNEQLELDLPEILAVSPTLVWPKENIPE